MGFTDVKLSELEAAVEAILFLSGGSVSLASLQRSLAQDERTARSIVEKLRDYYEQAERGIRLVELDGSYQLCTSEKYAEYVTRLMETPQKKLLTPPLIETLSIIAYKQPITKAAIEEIRGVSADHAVNRLVEFGLVAEAGRLDAPGRPILFVTTEEFLRHFGLSSLGLLPDERLFAMEEADIQIPPLF